MADVATLNSEASNAALTVTGADLATTYGLNNTVKGQAAGLTVTYADATGTTDTAKLSINNAGNKTTAATTTQTINVSNTNAIEAVTIATAGTNYVSLTGGTAAASVKVTGNGTNDLTIGSSAAALTLDASGSTGTNTLRVGTGLSGTDTIKGGSGSDTLIANLTSATQINPTVTGVETLSLDFDAAATYNAGNTSGVTTLNIGGSAAAAAVTNLAAAAKTLVLDTTNAAGVSVSYASGSATAAVYNTGSATADTAVSNGSTTLSNIASLTVNAGGTGTTTGLGALDVGSTATALTLNTAAAANDLTAGALTGAALKTITVGATAGDVSLSTGANATLTKLEELTIVSTGGGDVNVLGGRTATVHDTNVSAFKKIKITTGDSTTLTVGAITGGTGTTAAAITTYDVTMGGTIGASAIGAVTAESIGNVNVTVGANATGAGATLTVGALTADTIGNITVVVGAENIVAMSSDQSGAANYSIGNITASGAGTFTFTAASGAAGDDSIGSVTLSSLDGGSTVDLALLEGGTSMTGGAGVDNLTGTSGADIINGGAGADVLVGGAGADEITGGAGADTITSGLGNDNVTLTETTSAVDTLKYANSLTTDVDTVVGFKSGTDVISFSIGNIVGAATALLGDTAGTSTDAAIAVGAYTTISVNAATDGVGTAGAGDTTDAIFLSSLTATSFATAIGTSDIDTDDTDVAVTEGVVMTWYDSANGQAVFGYLLNTDQAVAVDALDVNDTFVEVARVAMIVGDYTLANIDGSLSAY